MRLAARVVEGNHEHRAGEVLFGTAVVSRDRAQIRELYQPDWKMWFDAGGDPRHGTADDPRMVLIGVTVHAAEFLEVNKPRPVLLFELRSTAAERSRG